MKRARALTLEQKKADIDIWIILIATLAMFLFYSAFREPLMAYVASPQKPVILRLLCNAVFQFGIAGLGITVVCLWRGEHFSRFGLIKRNTIKSVAGTAACFIPYLLFVLATGSAMGYRPFQILIARDVLRSGFPLNVLGMLLIALVWGFFEGFNYAVISDKLNTRYPSKNKWLDVGAITCAAVCLIFHPLDFSIYGIIEMLTTFAAIYGMLIVKRQTGNAWGCVFAFCFIWNAI